MSIGTLLHRLDGVRETGPGRWLARCPAHDDKSPSLSIRTFDDGRTLLHDFAGCDVSAVLRAVGLDFSALFPPREVTAQDRVRRAPPIPYKDLLIALENEAWVCLIGGSAALRGEITTVDMERMGVAVQRIGRAMRAAGVAP